MLPLSVWGCYILPYSPATLSTVVVAINVSQPQLITTLGWLTQDTSHVICETNGCIIQLWVKRTELQSEELHNLHLSPNIIRWIKSSRTRQTR